MKKTDKIIIIVLCVLCVASICAMVWAISKYTGQENEPQKPEFVPPEFEGSAIVGQPTPPEELGYSELRQDGMGFGVGICGNVIVNDKNADVYFYNCDDNDVWLKLRIIDEKGNIIGETGLLKPSEYVQSVEITEQLQDDDKIKLKIMAYEPETYYSEGSVVMNTRVRLGD